MVSAAYLCTGPFSHTCAIRRCHRRFLPFIYGILRDFFGKIVFCFSFRRNSTSACFCVPRLCFDDSASFFAAPFLILSLHPIMKLKKKSGRDCPVKHIAFIMDGNGRWAKKRGMPREFGHKKGAEVFKNIMEYCGDIGIEAATFYVFSTENWKRSEKEVNALMALLDEYLDDCEKRLLNRERDVRFVFIGDKSGFSLPMRAKMNHIEKLSENNSRIVNLAINYGGRSELTHAFNELMESGKQKVSEEDISSALYTNASPELDMVVRTGGELRLSNFLLWQAAYAELYFTDKLWPDFTADDVDDAIEAYKKRQRRFGGI